MRLQNAVAQRTGTITQPDCDAIAARLNSRPRKRLGYRRSAVQRPGRRERKKTKWCSLDSNLRGGRVVPQTHAHCDHVHCPTVRAVESGTGRDEAPREVEA